MGMQQFTANGTFTNSTGSTILVTITGNGPGGNGGNDLTNGGGGAGGGEESVKNNYSVANGHSLDVTCPTSHGSDVTVLDGLTTLIRAVTGGEGIGTTAGAGGTGGTGDSTTNGSAGVNGGGGTGGNGGASPGTSGGAGGAGGAPNNNGANGSNYGGGGGGGGSGIGSAGQGAGGQVTFTWTDPVTANPGLLILMMS